MITNPVTDHHSRWTKPHIWMNGQLIANSIRIVPAHLECYIFADETQTLAVQAKGRRIVEPGTSVETYSDRNRHKITSSID
jgi:hypothetical protein